MNAGGGRRGGGGVVEVKVTGEALSIAVSPLARRAIECRVFEIISANLGVEINSLDSNSSFRELGADRLDLFAIKMEMEDALGITIPDGDAEHFITVGDAVEYVLSHRRRDG